MPRPGAPRPHLATPAGPREAVAFGADLFERGFYWEAHEVWEAIWRSTAPGPGREALQGLIQAAAALVLARLGRAEAAERTARRASERLRVGRLPPALDPGLDLRALGAAIRQGKAAPIVR